MSVKVYGICGTNKCKREVVPKGNELPKNWIYSFGAHKTDFTVGDNGTAYITKNDVFGARAAYYTVDCLYHDDNYGTYVHIPVKTTAEEVSQGTESCAYCHIKQYDTAAGTTELYVSISKSLYDLISGNSAIRSVVFVCRRYK